MTGYVIRAANEKVSSVTTSNTLLNTIHEIIDRAIKVQFPSNSPAAPRTLR